MKSPTFLEGVSVAFIASLIGSGLFVALTTMYAGGTVVRLLIASLSLAYVLYLLKRSRERTGRSSVIVAWLAFMALVWLFAPSLEIYLLAHIGMVWLIRSLYFYSSLLSAFADLGLHGLSLVAATWAYLQSNSLFLSIWCFFLVQALFVAIPNQFGKAAVPTSSPAQDDRFEQAHQAAEAVLRRFISTD